MLAPIVLATIGLASFALTSFALTTVAGGTARVDDPSAEEAPGDRAEYRIGVLFWHDSPNDRVALEGFRAGLELRTSRYELDVVNVHSDEAAARERLRSWAETPVDLVLALGTRAAQLAREHAGPVPVVFTAVTNPVLTGVAEGWEGSGADVTGNSNWIPAATVLRTFRRAVPGMRRLGVIASRKNPVPAAEIEEMKAALAADPNGGLELEVRLVDTGDELTEAARHLVERVDAIWIPIDFLVYENLHRIRAVTDPAKIPLLSSSKKGAEAGAIVGIIVDYSNLGKNAAALAVRILEDGDAPRSIPIGRLSGYRTIVHLARAREIGYRLPLEVVCTADQILR